MKTYILYHAQCPDGFGAAFAAWKVLGNTAEYFAVSHGYAPPKMEKNAQVYLVDFCYPKDILLEIVRNAHQVTVLDHHQTAEADLQSIDLQAFPNLSITFDMHKSGAVLAWEHFHQAPVPDLLKFIEDKDLWLFKLPNSKEVTAAIRGYEMKFDVWDKFEIPQLILEGTTLLKYQSQTVDKLCKNMRMEKIGNFEVPTVNSSILQSEIGNQLCKIFSKSPFACVYFDSADKRHFSLRSIGDFDVSAIAKPFGGGGHRNASGFATGLKDLF